MVTNVCWRHEQCLFDAITLGLGTEYSMCGLVGVVTSKDVGVCIYDTLTVLQHRGQDAAGIMTSDNGKLNLRKDNGLIKDVFRTRHMRRLTGQMGIGHVRYPTAGSSSPALAQPFYVNSPYGLALAHNGLSLIHI